MMHKKFREKIRRSRSKRSEDFVENLYEIGLNASILKDIKIKVFVSADMEWLDFVLMCRE